MKKTVRKSRQPKRWGISPAMQAARDHFSELGPAEENIAAVCAHLLAEGFAQKQATHCARRAWRWSNRIQYTRITANVTVAQKDKARRVGGGRVQRGLRLMIDKFQERYYNK